MRKIVRLEVPNKFQPQRETNFINMLSLSVFPRLISVLISGGCRRKEEFVSDVAKREKELAEREQAELLRVATQVISRAQIHDALHIVNIPDTRQCAASPSLYPHPLYPLSYTLTPHPSTLIHLPSSPLPSSPHPLIPSSEIPDSESQIPNDSNF